MTQVKKWLKNKTKKELIEQVLMGIEMNAQQSLQEWDRYEELFQELLGYKKHIEILESALNGCESANRWYENMSVWQFIKSKISRKYHKSSI